jgi:hypothetical protein
MDPNLDFFNLTTQKLSQQVLKHFTSIRNCNTKAEHIVSS